MYLGLIIFGISALIFAYFIKENREQKAFEEFIGQNKTSKEKPEEEQQEPEEPIEPEEPKTEYREPHLKSDPEVQKWLYVYDSMEQLKRENEYFQEELEKMHKKITLLWVIAVIVIAFYVLCFILLASAGISLIALFKALVN